MNKLWAILVLFCCNTGYSQEWVAYSAIPQNVNSGHAIVQNQVVVQSVPVTSVSYVPVYTTTYVPVASVVPVYYAPVVYEVRPVVVQKRVCPWWIYRY